MRRNCATIRRILRRQAVTAVLSTVVCGAAFSDVPDARRDEVDHLLEFVRTSTCMVERNGTKHSGENAHSHIQKKYDYFRDKIGTSEDFIAYSATKSTMSGKYYIVSCEDGPPIRTQIWLLRELEKYRKEQHG